MEEYVQTTDPADLDGIKKEYDQKVAGFDACATAVLEGGDVGGVKVVATDNAEVRAAVEKMDKNHEALQQRAQELMAAHRAALLQNRKAEEAMEALDAAGDEAGLALDQVEQAAAKEMDVAKAEGATAKTSAIASLITIVGISIFAGIVIGTLLGRGISKAVRATVAMIKDIAEGEGDLTKRLEVRSNDELGQLATWFNKFVQKVHDIIGDVGASANDVASASTEIAASSEEMATGMNEQTQQITQVSAAVEEMSASVVEVARKSTDAARNASESGEVAQEGGKVVGRTIEGMKSINEAVTSSAASVAELGKRGEQIGEIIEVINDIADQTNLLALNAAIEAARAGEHGRGFAVVADEVRKLADRTTKATEEIGVSIKAIQTETTQAVERMNTGTVEVERGVESATEAGASLGKIVGGAQEVAGMIQDIAAAAEQQSASAEEISRNIESISAVTKQSSEGAGQAAAAATQLSRRAEELQTMVGQFKISR